MKVRRSFTLDKEAYDNCPTWVNKSALVNSVLWDAGKNDEKMEKVFKKIRRY